MIKRGLIGVTVGWIGLGAVLYGASHPIIGICMVIVVCSILFTMLCFALAIVTFDNYD